MLRILMRGLGCLLLSCPIWGAFIAIILTIGPMAALSIFGTIAGVVVVMYLGGWLIERSGGFPT